ncbi:MAG: hypothetical protein ACLT38_05195 [Akkermansia sp.]
MRQRLAALAIPPSIRIMALRDRPESNRGIRVRQAQVSNGRLVLDLEVLRQGFNPNQPEDVPVHLSVDNAAASATLQLAGESTAIRKEIPLPQGKESGFGFVSLPHDDFTRDDISFFTFAPRPLANILIFGPSGEVGKTLSLMSAPPGLPNRKATMPGNTRAAQAALASQSMVAWYGPPPRAEMEEKLLAFIEEGGIVLFLPDDTAHGTRHPFLGVSWGAMETAPPEEYYRLETWDRQRGFLRDGSDQAAIPANRLRAVRRKPLLGKYRTLASWDDGSCALAQVRAGTGSALFLGTLPRYSWSNLADGHLLLPLLQRMADRGAERFSTSISLRVNDPALPQSATDIPVRMDNAQGSHPSGSPADTAGVYRLGAQTYAVNRPWPEDMPDQITDEKLHLLLPEASISSMQSAEEAPSLVQEAWKLFLFFALACLLMEASCACPARRPNAPPTPPVHEPEPSTYCVKRHPDRPGYGGRHLDELYLLQAQPPAADIQTGNSSPGNPWLHLLPALPAGMDHHLRPAGKPKVSILEDRSGSMETQDVEISPSMSSHARPTCRNCSRATVRNPLKTRM